MRRSRYDEFLEMQAQQTNDCILWPYTTSRGYGRVGIHGGTQYVHRLSAEAAHGPAPFPDAQAAHSCRNRHCFNPRHLRWATPKENQQDRLRDGTDHNGDRCPTARLAPLDVYMIREMIRQGIPQHMIAGEFSVDPSTVSRIHTKSTWRMA